MNSTQSTRLPKSTLLIGPMPPPVNGQSLCFKVVADGIPNPLVIDRNVDQFGLYRKLYVFTSAYLQALLKVIFSDVSTVYISVSRSWPGTLFDTSLILLSKILKKHVVLHLHGNDFLKSSLKRKLFAWVYSKVDCMIALSQPMQAYLEKIIHCPVRTILNPVQDYFFQTEQGKEHSGPARLVYMSNIMMSKGIFDFLQLAEALKGSELDTRYEFHVIGRFLGDHMMNAHETEAKFKTSLEQLPNVTYHGSLYGSELAHTLSHMDVLIFPSFYPVEALPLSVLEAAALGLYIVVNDHNDLSVFKQLLPHVHVSDTSNPQEVLAHLNQFSKTELNGLGQKNAMKAKSFSTENHLAEIREALSLPI